MSGDAPSGLFGEPAQSPMPPPAWRVELAGVAADGAARSESVRVTLIDALTGRRLGAVSIPWAWFSDVASAGSTVVAPIVRGVWP